MGQQAKRAIFAVLGIAVLIGAATFQNCSGTRYLTANSDTSEATVQSGLASAIGASSLSISSTSDSTVFQTAGEMAQEGASTVFYAYAPGSMGDMSIVAPLDFSYLTAGTNPNPVSQIYAYFIEDPEASGTFAAMILTGYSAALGGVAAATPTPAATGTATTTAATGSINFRIGAVNSSASGLAPADFSGDTFSISLQTADGINLMVYSDDVEDGDLADTFKLEVYAVDSSGNEGYIGQIFFTDDFAD